MKLGHFGKHFYGNTGKGCADKNFGVFFPRYSWEFILNGIFNPKDGHN